jgi:hypothetical protein
MPGFDKSFIMNTASQTGVRCSRRLIGEYIVTEDDVRNEVMHHDTISVCPSFIHSVSENHPHMYIPYRTPVPHRIDNILTAGQCVSSDQVANNFLSPIQFCVAMGQASGTVAALSISQGVTVRAVDYKILQNRLTEQDVPLPTYPDSP